jgi:hypothetical protein
MVGRRRCEDDQPRSEGARCELWLSRGPGVVVPHWDPLAGAWRVGTSKLGAACGTLPKPTP